jgi:N-acetylmuramoyl-L-alanine amidase/peptidoglycan/xylan/chitin deacetylase (PgdA/CDA1 family)
VRLYPAGVCPARPGNGRLVPDPAIDNPARQAYNTHQSSVGGCGVRRVRQRFFFLSVLVLALAAMPVACGGAAAQVAPSPTVAPVAPVPTVTATPAATATATAAPTVTPRPTNTPIPTVTPTVTPTATPRPRTIFVDAGHGGKDPGAVHYGPDGQPDLVEKELDFDVANRLGALLRAQGYAVVYARQTDAPLTGNASTGDRESRRVEIQARVDLANKAQADLFVSVHFNGHGNKDVSGTEVYYCQDRPFSAKSKALAQLTLDAMVRELAAIGYKTNNRGIHDDYSVQYAGYHFFALGPTAAQFSQMPGILGEGLFVSNDAEAALLIKDGTRQAMARAYASAIQTYFTGVPTATVIANLPLTVTQAARAVMPTRGGSATVTATPTPTPTAMVPRELGQGDKSKKQIALTFDAGASSAPAAAILDDLKAAGVRSTMFLTGQWIQDNPVLLRRMVADGHEIGNHTMRHPDLETLTDAQIEDQLLSTARLFREHTGQDMAPYFRPPFGSRDARVRQAAWRAGFRSVYWTLDSRDWTVDATPEAVRQKVLTGAQNGAIVVMHLGSAHTPKVLPQIITELRAAGYILVTVSQVQ